MSVEFEQGVGLRFEFETQVGYVGEKIMFDFEKLTVYQKANKLNISILRYLHRTKIIDPNIKDQLKGLL